MTALEALYVEHLLTLASEDDVIRGAEVLLQEVEADDSILDLCALAALPVGSPKHAAQVGGLLERAVLVANPDFDSRSVEAADHARLALHRQCRRGLEEACQPLRDTPKC